MVNNLSDSEKNKKESKFNIKNFIANLSTINKIKILISISIVIVVLFIFSNFFTKSTNDKNINQNTIIESSSYVKQTEDRLKNILSGVKGIENVKVFVYVKSSEEIVYLKDSEENSPNSATNNTGQLKETTIFNKDGSSSSAIVVVTKYPTIEGVLIVAAGAGNVKTKLTIIDAVSCVLSIAPKNIEVLEGKS